MGIVFPDIIEICWFDWVWIDWPQLKEPISDLTKAYIDSIDIDSDEKTLKTAGIVLPKSCFVNMKLSTLLLKIGASNKLTIYDIATLICRSKFDEPSPLEITIQEIVKELRINTHGWDPLNDSIKTSKPEHPYADSMITSMVLTSPEFLNAITPKLQILIMDIKKNKVNGNIKWRLLRGPKNMHLASDNSETSISERQHSNSVDAEIVANDDSSRGL